VARGIGRGLAAILPEPEAADELRDLPVALIKPNPAQPRTRFEPDALASLAASIEVSGVVQPLLVRPLPDGSYELVAGERRWRAARQAGLERVPAVVRDAPEPERLQTALIENMVREDLNPVEEARACAALVEDLGVSKRELARRVGRSRPAVSNLIRLLELPDEALELLETGALSEGHGRALLQARGNDERRRLARAAAAEGWSVRQTEERARRNGSERVARRRVNGIVSAEEAEALESAAERLESALGQEVRVRRRGPGVAAEMRFSDLAEIDALLDRLAPR
jgi:ParB family chromosome partitioning protein